MLVDCVRLRDRGKPTPRWQYGGRMLVQGARLELGEERDEVLRRTVLVARLYKRESREQHAPELRDVQLLRVRNDDMVLSGIEVIEDACHVQSWWVRIVSLHDDCLPPELEHVGPRMSERTE